jgi:hypothetical protein
MSYPHLSTDCGDHHDMVVDWHGPAPESVVTLCGSTRFVDEFNRHRRALTEAGHIVLAIEVVTTQARSDDPQHANPGLKAKLDDLHRRKIDLSSWILVVSDASGYFGDSTAGEIRYAQATGKRVVFDVPAAEARWVTMADEALVTP